VEPHHREEYVGDSVGCENFAWAELDLNPANTQVSGLKLNLANFYK